AYVDRAEEAFAPALRNLRDKLGEGDEVDFGLLDRSNPKSKIQNPKSSWPASRNVLENARFRVEVDPASGGITSLVSKRTGREWVDPSSPEPFGGYRYDLYSATDIADFLRAYGTLFQDWFVQDFGKTGYPEDSVHLTAYARDFELSGMGGTNSVPT